MSAPEETLRGAKRIDRWLFGARLFKTRSAAADAVGGGKVHLNGERVKPSNGVKPGDTVTFTRGAVVFGAWWPQYRCVVVQRASRHDVMTKHPRAKRVVRSSPLV